MTTAQDYSSHVDTPGHRKGMLSSLLSFRLLTNCCHGGLSGSSTHRRAGVPSVSALPSTPIVTSTAPLEAELAVQVSAAAARCVCRCENGHRTLLAFFQCSSPVSLRDHPAGLMLWFQWLDRIPFDLMTVENLTLSDGAAKPLASDLLYQYHDEFYSHGGELLA